jgi:ornithine cyclodeaminase/alanine dehydrogenase-like protein (mu-crystallin family)
LFKSLGCALEDLVTANLIYHQALKNDAVKI